MTILISCNGITTRETCPQCNTENVQVVHGNGDDDNRYHIWVCPECGSYNTVVLDECGWCDPDRLELEEELWELKNHHGYASILYDYNQHPDRPEYNEMVLVPGTQLAPLRGLTTERIRELLK